MGWFSHDCKTDGHRTEARYNRVFPEAFMKRLTKMSGDVDSLKIDVYVHDICVRCGEIFDRDGK